MAQVYDRFICITCRIGLLGFVVRTQASVYKEYMDLVDTEAWKLYIELKIYKLLQEVWWPSGKASHSGTRGRGFEPHSGRRVVSLRYIYL